MNIPVRATLLTFVLAGFIHAAQPAAAATERIHRQSTVHELLPVTTIGDAEATVSTVGEYLVAQQRTDYDAVVAQAAATDAFLASLYVPPAPPPAPAGARTPAYSGGSTVGECTGFAIPDYIIQRESGGNASAMNPSGAYGCAQTLLSHYNGGSCTGLDPYTIDGQRACVNILSDGGTNLAPWAETR